jgi:CO/xanthine dehydrogenase FAD-binding subunit
MVHRLGHREETYPALAARLKPIDDLRASAAYRRDVAAALWMRFAAEARDGATTSRIRAYG